MLRAAKGQGFTALHWNILNKILKFSMSALRHSSIVRGSAILGSPLAMGVNGRPQISHGWEEMIGIIFNGDPRMSLKVVAPQVGLHHRTIKSMILTSSKGIGSQDIVEVSYGIIYSSLNERCFSRIVTFGFWICQQAKLSGIGFETSKASSSNAKQRNSC